MTLQHDLLNCSHSKKEYLCAAGPWKALVGAAPINSCAVIALSSGLGQLHAQHRAQHKGFAVKHSKFSMVVAQGRTPLSVPRPLGNTRFP